MIQSGRAPSSFILLVALATGVGCQPKQELTDAKPSQTEATAVATASASSSEAAPAAGGPLAKLEGSRADLHEGAKEIAESGDGATKQAAGPTLVKRLRAMREPAFREELRPTLEKANALSKLAPTPEQLEAQLTAYQDEEVQKLVAIAGKIGGPAISAYLLELAQDGQASSEVRRAALDALEPLRPGLDPSAIPALDAAREKLKKPPVGNVAVGAGDLSGGKVENASAVVAGMAAGFRRCFNKGLQTDPTMAGTVKVTAKIGKNGEVLSAIPAATGTLSKTVVECINARVASAQFAPPVGGLAVIVIPVSVKADAP